MSLKHKHISQRKLKSVRRWCDKPPDSLAVFQSVYAVYSILCFITSTFKLRSLHFYHTWTSGRIMLCTDLQNSTWTAAWKACRGMLNLRQHLRYIKATLNYLHQVNRYPAAMRKWLQLKSVGKKGAKWTESRMNVITVIVCGGSPAVRFFFFLLFVCLHVWQMCGLCWFWLKIHWSQGKERNNTNNLSAEVAWRWWRITYVIWAKWRLSPTYASHFKMMIYNFFLKRLSGGKMDFFFF